MGFIKIVVGTVWDFAGQLITGIGFMIFLGAIVAQLWIMVLVSMILMLIGFLMRRP